MNLSKCFEALLSLQMVASKRKRRCLNDAKGCARKDIRAAIYPDLSGRDFNFGDVSWVRTGSYSWWPAQVVNEKSVGPCFRPTRKEESEVLVRLYGTYSYQYIDPAKNNEEFENTIRQNNSSMGEMLEKTLEMDLSRIKRHHKTKRYPRLSKEHVNAGASTHLEMQERIERTKETDSITCVEMSSVKDEGRGANCTDNSLMKHYVRKKQVRQKGRGGTLGDMKQEINGESGMNCSKKLGKAGNVDPGNWNSKKNREKPPVTAQCGDGTLENLHEDEVREQVKEKTGYQVRQKQGGKLESKQHDVTRLEQDEVKEPKMKKKDIQEKKQKLTEKTRHEVAKYNNEMQDSERKTKLKDVPKHGKVDVGGHVGILFVKHAQVGKTGDASARRMKVMQSLALIAPSDSPYC
ncbi:hypothetical protein Taro_013543 [Colocasia esculenta]|uniref:PWWP domain-containing protein n=1 Tax=Colocasia esculenta TaxID=4460 RepID=A0A843UGR9_COLES|nr:hypothetical protein [Colocasia esculenta]